MHGMPCKGARGDDRVIPSPLTWAYLLDPSPRFNLLVQAARPTDSDYVPTNFVAVRDLLDWSCNL